MFFSNPTFDLLGTDASLTFTTPPPPGGTEPFSFAVIGDWGATDPTGANPDQANLFAQLARQRRLVRCQHRRHRLLGRQPDELR